MLKVWLHLAFVGIVCQSPHLSRCVCMAVGLVGSRSATSRVMTRDIRVFAQETTTDDEPSKWQSDSVCTGTQGGCTTDWLFLGSLKGAHPPAPAASHVDTNHSHPEVVAACKRP